jgi:hypothetical protein
MKKKKNPICWTIGYIIQPFKKMAWLLCVHHHCCWILSESLDGFCLKFLRDLTASSMLLKMIWESLGRLFVLNSSGTFWPAAYLLLLKMMISWVLVAFESLDCRCWSQWTGEEEQWKCWEYLLVWRFCIREMLDIGQFGVNRSPSAIEVVVLNGRAFWLRKWELIMLLLF